MAHTTTPTPLTYQPLQSPIAQCSANTYEQCAIYKNPDTADHLPFVNCLASKGSAQLRLESTFEECATSAGLDFDQIKACHDDEDLAWSLQVEFAGLTPDDHQYTPWVVLDGEVYEGEDFLADLCKAYVKNGGKGPKGCPEATKLRCMKN